jgi:hypothetical protein
LALRDIANPERLNQVVDPPRRDALRVRLLGDRHQRPLGPLLRFQQRRIEAPVPDAWHVQLDRVHARIPLPLAVAVALPRAPRRPLVSAILISSAIVVALFIVVWTTPNENHMVAALVNGPCCRAVRDTTCA